MRNYSKTVGALAAASTLVAGTAMAEIEGEIHVGYHNMYEFRFVDLGSDLVEAGVDIAYDAGPVSLSAGAWYASVNDNKAGRAFNFEELDLYAAVGTSLGPVDLEFGYIFYHFLDAAGSDTQEIYVSASTELFWGIGIGSTLYYDFDANNGLYVDTSISKSFELNDCLALDLAAGFGYADGHGLQGAFGNPNPGATHDGYQGFYVSAALPWEFREGVTLTPYVKYADAASGLASDFTTGTSNGKDMIVAGAALAVAW
ncbi:MAG: TorF family putative porin [Verrucomicrobiota bacterium]